MKQTVIVVPNWNGKETLGACLDSLLNQSVAAYVVVVDNGSSDGSVDFITTHYPEVHMIVNQRNLGFAGGVNCGICQALDQNAEFVALFNNDAVADNHWLEQLLKEAEGHPGAGIITGKLVSFDRKFLDSTGDMYTNWGLPYPRGRDDKDLDKYDQSRDIFGASGGASLFRTVVFKEIGLFDEDFFAYYEDIDLSFRAQLAGWKVRYAPQAVAYHHIGHTSNKIKGFTTYQTMKNLPLVWLKNVPSRYLWSVGWRLGLANCLFILRAFVRRQGIAALKGSLKSLGLIYNKLPERKQIQANKKVSDDYFWGIIVHDLPPNAAKLRRVRLIWRRLARHG